MAGRNRWPPNPDGPNDSDQVHPGPDYCCCCWLKPKSKPIDPGPKSKPIDPGPKSNAWFVPDSSPGVSMDQQGTTKTNKYTENDPTDTAKNVALKENPVWTGDQENSHGIPSSQQEIMKNGKYTAPNAANVTQSKDQDYSSEENNASQGGTRPEKTISSTVEQASILKEKANDRIKNRQEDILEDHHKAVHKPEYNHGIDRDKGNHGGTRSDPTKSSTFENDRIKNRHEGILEDHHKAVHKQEYNHGIHRDKGPDLTKKESSSPEQAAGVQKREGKQKETKGINNNDEQFKDC